MLSVVTSHGRTTPLLWKTVRKSQLAKRRNAFEDALLLRLRQVIPESVRVTILCDRGFADQKLYEYLKTELGFHYIVRFRSGITVTDASGRSTPRSSPSSDPKPFRRSDEGSSQRPTPKTPRRSHLAPPTIRASSSVTASKIRSPLPTLRFARTCRPSIR